MRIIRQYRRPRWWRLFLLTNLLLLFVRSGSCFPNTINSANPPLVVFNDRKLLLTRNKQLLLSSPITLLLRQTRGGHQIKPKTPIQAPGNQRNHGSSKLSSSSSIADNNMQEQNGEGTATISNEIFNLVKSIIGAGVLSLPAGIAAFGSKSTALIPACVLIAIMGSISAYTFVLIARVCKLCGARTYSEAWEKTRSSSSSWIVALSSMLDCFAGNLTYSMVLADTFRDLLLAFGITLSRSNSLLVLTTTVLLPLCLVKDLASLAPFSLVGICGMIYTAIVIAIRYFGGSYDRVSGGRFLSQLSSQPSFGNIGARGVFSTKSLILISMLSTAYIAHFNAPKFYSELKNNTMGRFNIVVGTSFGLSVIFYSVVSSLAFLTFGSSTAPMILSNYATTDQLLGISRFAVGLSLIFSYPLLFVGTRDGLLDLLQIPIKKRGNSKLINQLTVVLLSIITAVAMKVTDLTLVASLSGALLGTSLIFIFPTLMFRAATTSKSDINNKNNNNKLRQFERQLCSVICCLGFAIAGIGAKMAFKLK